MMFAMLAAALALIQPFVWAAAAPADSNGAPAVRETSEFRLEVDPFHNRMTVYRDGKIFRIYPIAAGKPDTPSPVGDWVIVHKAKDWAAASARAGSA